MMNRLTIDGYTAIIGYDEEIDMFRGEFVGLNGGADFYASDIVTLHKEARISLDTFLAVCQEKGIVPTKQYSGKLNAHIDPTLHKQLEITARSQGISVGEFLGRAIKNELAIMV